jgi:hypothetical protein
MLEGWDGRIERQWRTSATDTWHSEESWHRLTEHQQTMLTPLIAQEGMSRLAKLSRWQVWHRGVSKLIRLPDYATALICGRDLAEVRPCPSNGEIIFIDQEVSATPMVYRLQSCVDADGRPVKLYDGRIYRWMVNPFDATKAFVLDAGGAYVGRVERVQAVDRLDTEAVHQAMGKAKADFNAALAPLAARGAKIVRAQLDALRSNTQLLQEGSMTKVAPKKSDAQVEQDEAAIDAALDLLDTGSN